MNSCFWDGGYGPYGSERSYCESQDRVDNTPACLIGKFDTNTCLLAFYLDLQKCKNKSTSDKPYWW